MRAVYIPWQMMESSKVNQDEEPSSMQGRSQEVPNGTVQTIHGDGGTMYEEVLGPCADHVVVCHPKPFDVGSMPLSVQGATHLQPRAMAVFLGQWG